MAKRERESVLSEVREICKQDGHGVDVVDVYEHGDGFVVITSLPSKPSLDDRWSVLQSLANRLQGIAGVHKVCMDIPVVQDRPEGK